MVWLMTSCSDPRAAPVSMHLGGSASACMQCRYNLRAAAPQPEAKVLVHYFGPRPFDMRDRSIDRSRDVDSAEFDITSMHNSNMTYTFNLE
jgi:hypothetical protein